MKECAEKIVMLGFKRDPKKVFDEVDMVSATMIRDGWVLKDSCVEDGLGKIHLFFEREIDSNSDFTS